MLITTLDSDITVLTLIWQMMISNFMLSIPIALLIINLVLTGIDKLVKLLKH